jgi:hypothetical protein
MDTLTLPEPLAAYFAAEHQPEALARCFTADAVMKDDGHLYTGIDAILAFLAAASVRYSATTVPFALAQDGGLQVVRATVTGNFPGNRVNLTYRFRIERDQIASLEITA